MCRRHTRGDTTGRRRRRRTRSPRARFGAKTDAVDEQLAARLVAKARERGISLVGPDGLLLHLTKLVLKGELTDHLGWVQLRSRDLMSGRTDDRPGGRAGKG